MALGSALVDKAETLRREAETEGEGEEVWVDGEKQFVPAEKSNVPSPKKTFRCRFQEIKGSEQQQDGRRRRVVRPSLLWGRKMVLQKGDKVRVFFKQKQWVEKYGESAVFQVDGDPEPLRKRRTIIGFEATLVKAE